MSPMHDGIYCLVSGFTSCKLLSAMHCGIVELGYTDTDIYSGYRLRHNMAFSYVVTVEST